MAETQKTQSRRRHARGRPVRLAAAEGIQAQDRPRPRGGRERGQDARRAGAARDDASSPTMSSGRSRRSSPRSTRKLTEQINLILHNERFQQLESAWRGLHYLVNHTETDEMLKIRVMNISKKDLGRTLKKYKGAAWDQSPIFKKLYEEEYGQLGGEPYGALIGDYYFDHTPGDVELLGQMAQIAAAAHAPFIAAPRTVADGHGFLAGTGQSARPEEDLRAPRTTPPGARCAIRTTPSTSASPCRASWRGCPMAPRPTRSRSSTSRRMPTGGDSQPVHAGPMPPTRWR